MKKGSLFLATCALLAACNGGNSLAFTVNIAPRGESFRTELLQATLRFTEDRLKEMGEEPLDLNMSTSDSVPQLEVAVGDKRVADALTDVLNQSFSLRIMKETEPAEAEITNDHGSFKSIGITEQHIEWMAATPEVNTPPLGRITIIFTEEGRTLMANLFQESKGENIGIFVGDDLVAKLLVDTDELRDDIIISGVPSVDLAQSFADKVNVGLYITFTPLQ